MNSMYLDDIIDAQNHLEWLLSDPSNLLKTDEEFEEFLSLSDNINDLTGFLNVCNKNELYRWSAKIHSKIIKLQNENSILHRE